MKTKKTGQASTARDRLLESALKVFSRKGYAASIREIAEESGTTLPSLYYYFGSKEGLFLELMREHFGRFQSVMNDYDETESARENLKRFLMTTYLHMLEDLDFVRLMSFISYGPPQGAPPFDSEPYYRQLREFLTAMIKTGMKSGEFRSGNADDMAWVMRGVMHAAGEDLCSHSMEKLNQARLGKILDLILDGFSSEPRKKKRK
jgi:AcrR family transcriptional regulator